ncbi:response regulator [Cryomorphaceae bacterium 1068]|nr:response regulator [Cryomorphaceae bacterium 1068]
MLNSVIIIDDDSISILVTETMMRKNDFAKQIITFEQPQKALDFFKTEYSWDQGAPEYIFLDVEMPEIDAWEFMDSYKQIDPSIQKRKHIILLSATFNPDDETKARTHPMVMELITKPVNGHILERLK